MKIALFGSSFNPPHFGHQAVLLDLLRKNIFAEIWLVPVYQHAFQKNLWPYPHRVHMTRFLLDSLSSPQVKICEIEKELPSPSYTFNSVSKLKLLNPEHEFSLIVGEDIKTSLSKWYKIEELKKLVEFYFVPRGKNSPYPDISSSHIRLALHQGQDLAPLTLPEIANYLKEHYGP